MEEKIILAIYNTAKEHNKKSKENERKLKKNIKKDLGKIYHLLDNNVSECVQQARKLIANLVRTRLSCEKSVIKIEENDVASVSTLDETIEVNNSMSTYANLLSGANFP